MVFFLQNSQARGLVNSISGAISSPVCAGSFPEQRLVIKPRGLVNVDLGPVYTSPG